MKLRIRASDVKSWFQYQCQRKLVYDTMSRKQRKALPVLEREESWAPWAEFGDDYEAALVAELEQQRPGEVLRPRAGHDSLDEATSLRWLQRVRSEPIAVQLLLTETPAFRRLVRAPEEIRFPVGKLDVAIATENNGRPIFTLIDIKSTHVATVFHKMQVAWYALMLRGVLDENRIDADIDPVGWIWHRGNDGREETAFPLRSYEANLLEWAHRSFGTLAERRVEPRLDDTAFHLYFKCEQCRYLPHCQRSMSDEMHPADWDVSAVVGLSQASKAWLVSQGVATTGALAKAGGILREAPTWRIRGQRDALLVRARALLDGQVQRLPGVVTLRMPPSVDVAIYVVADRDPMEGRLVSAGVLVAAGDDVRQASGTATTLDEERATLIRVLGLVVETLKEVDRQNRQGDAGLVAHLFVYEPAEARDIADALGRHLHSLEFRRVLLDLVRIYPPDSAVAEPAYQGVQHLPACAVRSVLQRCFAVPVRTSMDLARVCKALMTADPPMEDPYLPAEPFQQPMSSRLGINPSQLMHRGMLSPQKVEADVLARLRALRGVERWIRDRNRETPAPDQFLRLRKGPFELIDRVNPLGGEAVDVLLAQTLLEQSVKLLGCLTTLAQTVEHRRQRLHCLAGLELIQERPGYDGGRFLLFRVPEREAIGDFRGTRYGLMLSDGHPDRVLDPNLWPQFAARTLPAQRPGQDTLAVVVEADVWNGARFQALYQHLGRHGWVLDRVHQDWTTSRMARFLSWLGGTP